MKHLKEDICRKHNSLVIEIKTECRKGDVLNVVREVVESEKVDAIVMGTKGATGLEEIFVGSVASEIIQHITCPIIGVPGEAKFRPPKRIALAMDYESLKRADVLDPLIEFVNEFESKLHIFHVEAVQESALPWEENDVKHDKLDAILEGVRHSFYRSYDIDLQHGISKFIDEHKIDMLAMIPHSHGFFDRLFNGSITEELAKRTKVPLLVLDDR